MISPRSSAERKSTFLVSNRSKQVLRHLISSAASPVASRDGHQLWVWILESLLLGMTKDVHHGHPALGIG